MNTTMNHPTTTDTFTDKISDSYRKAKNWDDAREGVPGEHWLTLVTGIGLVMASRRSRSTLTRVGGSALGAALVMRAASGRDGISKLLPYVPGVRDLIS